jgi:hypothetical protein
MQLLGLICGATCTVFRAGAVPRAPGARRGPQGAENQPKTRGRIYRFILPKVCPGVGAKREPGGAEWLPNRAREHPDRALSKPPLKPN